MLLLASSFSVSGIPLVLVPGTVPSTDRSIIVRRLIRKVFLLGQTRSILPSLGSSEHLESVMYLMEGHPMLLAYVYIHDILTVLAAVLAVETALENVQEEWMELTMRYAVGQ